MVNEGVKSFFDKCFSLLSGEDVGYETGILSPPVSSVIREVAKVYGEWSAELLIKKKVDPFLAKDPKGIVEVQARAREAVGHDALFAYADALFVPEASGCQTR